MRRAWLIIDGAVYRLLIMICQKKESVSYSSVKRMMVLAMDEECYPFVKGKHEIIMKDDCCPFVLTNIKGPVSVSEEVMDEILKGKAETFSWGPEQRLAKAATLRIKEILGIDD